MPKAIEHKDIAFEVKAIGEADDSNPGGSFEGLGACLFNLDSAGDAIAPGAFKGDLDKFLKDGFIGGLNHNWDAPLGHPASAEETAEGLLFTAVLDDVPDAHKMREQMKVNPRTGRATVRKLSIGYRVVEAEKFKDAEAVRAWWQASGYVPSAEDAAALASLYTKRKGRDGRDVIPGARMLKKLYLYEVSPVAVPANDRALILGSKALKAFGMAGGDDGPLGDVDEALAWTVMGRLHDMLCMAMYYILADEMAPIADRLVALGEAIDQFRAVLLDTLGYFLADEDAEDPEVPMDGFASSVGKMADQFKARFGIAPDQGEFAAKLAAATAPGFADQSLLVVSAVKGFVARADARIEARVKDGRELSAANRAALVDLHDGLMGHVATLAEMLDRTGPAKSIASEAAPQAGSGGSSEPGPSRKSAETPSEAKGSRVDPAVVRGLFTRHIEARRAALPAPVVGS